MMDSDEDRSESDGDENSDEENSDEDESSDEEENNSASPSPDISSLGYLNATWQTNVLDVAAELFGRGEYKEMVDRFTKEGHRSCIPYMNAGYMNYYNSDESLTQDFLSKLSFSDLNMVDKTVSTFKIFAIISNSR